MQKTLTHKSQRFNLSVFSGAILLLTLSSFFIFKYDLVKKRGEIIAYIDDSPVYSNDIAARIKLIYNKDYSTVSVSTRKILLAQELNQKLLLKIAHNQNWEPNQEELNSNKQYIKSGHNLINLEKLKTPPWFKLIFFTKNQYKDLRNKQFLQEKYYVATYLEFLKAEHFFELKENILSNSPKFLSNKQLIKLYFNFANKQAYDKIYEQLIAQEMILNKQLKFLNNDHLIDISFHEINHHLDPTFTYAISPEESPDSYSLEILIPLKHADLLANDLFENILLTKTELIIKNYISESSNRIKTLI